MEKLCFVYNADSGKWNAYLDMAHKVFSPATYPCSLCDLTYGIFKIRPAWEDFVEKSPISLEFLHKDEFHAQYPQFKDLPLPVVLKRQQNDLTLFLNQVELAEIKTIEALKNRILKP